MFDTCNTTYSSISALVGNITNGGVNGYLLRSGVVSASSGTLIVPAGSSAGNTPVTINLNGNGTYCIVGNTQKCFYPNPCTIPVSLSGPTPGRDYQNDAYARSYDADGVLIDSVGNSGNLNIYGASYIIINGGTEREEGSSLFPVTMNVANAYIDADTTVIPGMINPPTNGVFTGDVVGNVTGDVITTYIMTPKIPYDYTSFTSGNTSSADLGYTSRDNMVVYNVLPNQLLTGSIRASYTGGKESRLIFLDKGWDELSRVNLTNDNTDYTIPAGTNCIILTLIGNYQSIANGYIAKFDIAVV